ncbi:hypothetical protein N7516_000642, partial [Penicillium verrucosum]|uniref:uncharacterized protein n=1 Tax=Penicillium verrucosum TaxID=60171 RepID=UPI0025459095
LSVKKGDSRAPPGFRAIIRNRNIARSSLGLSHFLELILAFEALRFSLIEVLNNLTFLMLRWAKRLSTTFNKYYSLYYQPHFVLNAEG